MVGTGWVDDNRLLARGVAHDLKTPPARLRFGINRAASDRVRCPTPVAVVEIARTRFPSPPLPAA